MRNGEQKLNFPEQEEKILDFWEKNKIFEKSVSQRKSKKKFIFYEGPPYANGRPGIHHVEARAFKDIILRYKTMAGFHAPRRAGWDTHGLPTEMEVEKKLGIKSKKEIEEKIGIEKFVEEARENVFLYKEEWEKLTERMAYWLDMKNAYVTMANDYIETLWWIFKEIDKKKLLYEDYKIVPWCPRCGTALSSHEVSLGYRKIKEESIYIEFPVKSQPNTYFLVWTTTPWTLPSNVAIAVDPEKNYVEATGEVKGNTYYLIKESAERLGLEIVKTFKGKDLVGREYEPLYPNNAPYKVYPADFVTAEDGTGIVHIAPAFGEDDMNLGKKEKLPILSLVNEEGKMLTPGYKWDGMFIKDADPLIMEDLKTRNLLFKTEVYEHDYPFCWRCESPLMYYAKTSWWFKSTAVKQKMISENKKINWYPGYLKTGRFGEWLNELRDWAISRERYWGTSLPIWRCEGCKNKKVIGSLKELKEKTEKSDNKYFLMRHGFAEHNVDNIASSSIEKDNHNLLPKGKREIAKTAAKLKKEKIDLIISSDFLRTRETAKEVAGIIGIPLEGIIFDSRLRDVNVGIFDGKPDEEYHEYFSSTLEKFSKTPPDGENLTELKKRLMQFLCETEEKYKNRNILIISHEYSIWMLETGARGLSNKEAVELKRKNGGEKGDFIKTGEVRKLEFVPLPHDKNFVLDLHRPYIDEIFLKCEKCLPSQVGGGKMERVKEVADVWFDSGSMPFAQVHWPFAFAKSQISNLKSQKLGKLDYPADYICEAIDQTRGWFFTLLAVAVLLGKKAPYKNVLSLGLVLDSQGQKMSKSRGNVVEPMELMKKYGADAVRWYFFTINQPWDEKLFKEEDVASVLRRFILIFWNCFTYFNTYSNTYQPKVGGTGSRTSLGSPASIKLVINKWLLARFNQVVSETTKFLDNYEIVSAARLIENFVVEDISHWYIRRIRDIMKNPSSKEAKETGAVFGYVLINTAKIIAPFMPFISEEIYRQMGGNKKSVHLENWPVIRKLNAKDKQLLKEMEETRKVISQVLEARAGTGIKVRQPLSVINTSNAIVNKDWAAELIKGETNFKRIVFDKGLKEIKIDTAITSELKEEGILRDLIREFQDFRKKEGLKPGQMVDFYIVTDNLGKDFLVKHAEELKKAVSAKALIIKSDLEGGHEIKAGEFSCKIKI